MIEALAARGWTRPPSPPCWGGACRRCARSWCALAARFGGGLWAAFCRRAPIVTTLKLPGHQLGDSQYCRQARYLQGG